MGKKKKSQMEVVKMLGLKSEKHLNKTIHKWLDDPEIIQLMKLGANQHIHLMKVIRKYVEILLLQLNIPTKDDVANVAKVAIQIEEKLDCLEDRILALSGEEKMSKAHKKVSLNNKKARNGNVREMIMKNSIKNDPNLNLEALNTLLERLVERGRGGE